MAPLGRRRPIPVPVPRPPKMLGHRIRELSWMSGLALQVQRPLGKRALALPALQERKEAENVGTGNGMVGTDGWVLVDLSAHRANHRSRLRDRDGARHEPRRRAP